MAVTKYSHAEMNKPQLKFPEADAKALGTVLEGSGYKVDYLFGDKAKRAAVQAKLADLPNQGNADGVVLVGLFGHGVAVVERDPAGKPATTGYFCPFDSKVRDAAQADGRLIPGLIEPDPTSLVSLVDVMSALRKAGAPSRVVVADCCRKIANRARGRSLDFGTGFDVSNLPDGAAVLFGCAPGEQAFEHDDWGHGAFTTCLLEELDEMTQRGDATTGALIDRLKKKVPALVKTKAAPGETQTPKPFFTDSVDLQLKSSAPPLFNFADGEKTETETKLAQAAWAKHLGVEVEAINSIGLAMRFIPPGEFMMGSPTSEDKRANDETTHRVRLTKGFWLGKHEVTQAAYEQVMGRNPSYFNSKSSAEGVKNRIGAADTNNFPVEQVSWFDAVEFCNRLSEREGLKPAYAMTAVKRRDDQSIESAQVESFSTTSYRLPTEAEWEFACRAGTISPFNFGSVLNGKEANVDGDQPYGATTKGPSLQRPTTIGSYLANKFGLFDMHGNVLEWCSDWKAEYDISRSVAENPSGPADGPARVLRGGGWFNYPHFARSAYRNYYTPVVGGNYVIGFRVSRSQ